MTTVTKFVSLIPINGNVHSIQFNMINLPVTGGKSVVTLTSKTDCHDITEILDACCIFFFSLKKIYTSIIPFSVISEFVLPNV